MRGEGDAAAGVGLRLALGFSGDGDGEGLELPCFGPEEEGDGEEKKEVIWLCFRTSGERPLLRRRDAMANGSRRNGCYFSFISPTSPRV